jgi:hypothetical protein
VTIKEEHLPVEASIGLKKQLVLPENCRNKENGNMPESSFMEVVIPEFILDKDD